MKKKFNEVVGSNQRSGRQRTTMPFMEEMERLVGHRPSLVRPHGLDMDTAVRRAQAQLSPDVFGK